MKQNVISMRSLLQAKVKEWIAEFEENNIEEE